MNLILTLTSLILVQASKNANCEDNGAKKTHMRGSALYTDIMYISDCYNYGEDECPKKLEIPSASDEIFRQCEHEQDNESDGVDYKWYKCDEADRLIEWKDIFTSKGWTCVIH